MELKLNPDEAYRLSVSGKLIKIEAVTERGVYWALQTLRQLEKKKGKKSLFAGCEIVDWPAFRIRGFYAGCRSQLYFSGRIKA